MGNLSNLYISQSYKSLAHLGTDNALVSGTMTLLQDGIGQSLNISFDGTNISSSGNIFAANLTGSGVLPAGVISSSAQITGLGFVSSSITASSLITASFDNGTRNLTFTKGNNTTFAVNIPDLSGSSTLPSGVISGSEQITALGFVSSSITASSLITASAIGNTITFTKGDSTTFNVSVSSTPIDTSSFATTGSNQFNGSQSISGSVTLSGSLNNVNYIDFNTASAVPTWKSGRVYWDNTDGCLAVYNAEADITLQVGQEMWVRARNNTGVTIANGAAVRLVGAQGDNPLIVLAQSVQVSGSAITENQILGIATHAIETGTDGYVTTLGNVRGLNTNAYNEGDVLWVSSSAGLLTKVVPVAPYERIPVATVVKKGPGGSGIVYVAPIPPIDFSTLSSVEISGSYSTGDVWIYEGNVWKHKLKSEIGLTTTSSFNSYTSSNDAKVNSLISATGSYATTVTNNFTGPQTLTDSNFLNQITLGNYSGSLVLYAKGYTSSSLSHISGSNASTSASVGNLIFKTSNTTADTILTGSQNIFQNQTAPLTGFKRYIGGNANIFLGANSVPSISGSMGFSPVMNLSGGGGAYTFRGPVSSSTWTLNTNLNLGTINIGTSAANNAEKLTSGLTFSTNTIQGTINLTANQAFLTGSTTTLTSNTIAGTVTLNLNSSAATFSNNIINDSGFTLINNYFSSSVGLGALTVSRNNIIGQSNTISVSGSQPAGTTNATSYTDNLIGGGSNTLYGDISNARVVGANAFHSAIRNIIFGNQLIVSASSLLTDTNSFGSAFFGRWNAADTNRNKTAETIFSVGTGTSNTTRKTGFLIDSGSNSFFEGTVNVSGSLLISGTAFLNGVSLGAGTDLTSLNAFTASQLTINTGYNSFTASELTINAGYNTFTASINSKFTTLGSQTGSFATTGSNTFIGNERISGSLSVSGSTTLKGNTTFVSVDGFTSNIILGDNALINSIGNQMSIAIGQGAMRYASGSSQNVAIGIDAMKINSGSNNFALGSYSMEQNTTGNQNVAIGVGSLNKNISGSNNVAVGNDAGFFIASGSSNTLIGASAGNNINGSNNTIIGRYQGSGGVINNNIILADGAGTIKAQYSGSAWSLQDDIRFNKGSNKTCDIVTVGSTGATISNSLVTTDSIILATTQNSEVGGDEYPAVVSNKGTGTFGLSHNYTGNLLVAYLIINPTV